MPVSAIVTTAGDAAANAYVSVEVANQYNLDRAPDSISTAWEAATDQEKSAAILNATRMLDSLVEWTGWAVGSTQALLWPRSSMWDRAGYTVSSTAIPTELQHATAEFARQMLSKDRQADSDVETDGIKSIKAGPIAIQFKDDVERKAVPDAVVDLLPRGWYSLIRGRESNSVDLVRA